MTRRLNSIKDRTTIIKISNKDKPTVQLAHERISLKMRALEYAQYRRETPPVMVQFADKIEHETLKG